MKEMCIMTTPRRYWIIIHLEAMSRVQSTSSFSSGSDTKAWRTEHDFRRWGRRFLSLATKTRLQLNSKFRRVNTFETSSYLLASNYTLLKHFNWALREHLLVCHSQWHQLLTWVYYREGNNVIFLSETKQSLLINCCWVANRIGSLIFNAKASST